MEFGEEAENVEPSEEMSLAARLSKKTKAQPKEKGMSGFKPPGSRSTVVVLLFSHR